MLFVGFFIETNLIIAWKLRNVLFFFGRHSKIVTYRYSEPIFFLF